MGAPTDAARAEELAGGAEDAAEVPITGGDDVAPPADDVAPPADDAPARREVLAARAEVLAARRGLDDELVRLEAAGRAAIDIAARIKRQPAKVGGAAAGAAFLLLGGPGRVLRGARRAVFGREANLPKSMLPKQIETTLKELGPDGDRVRGTIEREFARYLEEKAPERRDRDLRGAAAAAVVALLRPSSIRAGRQLAERLFDPDGPSFAEGLRRARARMDRTLGDRDDGTTT